MEKEFVNYKQALKLKELGFHEPCFGYWNIDPYLPNPTFNMVKPFDHEWCVPTPLKQQVFRWFRDMYHICPSVEKNPRERVAKYAFRVVEKSWGYTAKTYEEAELACLDKLIEIVKKIKENDDMVSADIVGY